jgi:hypothetical protein
MCLVYSNGKERKGGGNNKPISFPFFISWLYKALLSYSSQKRENPTKFGGQQHRLYAHRVFSVLSVLQYGRGRDMKIVGKKRSPSEKDEDRKYPEKSTIGKTTDTVELPSR